MLSPALISLGVAGSALAWPSLGHSGHASVARHMRARQEPAVVKAKEPVAATWFASWHAQEFSLANVSWNKYTTVSYSFAETTSNVSFVNITDPEVFKDFVSTAHANNVSATISIGGWTGSLYFSSAVATAENRTEFVKTMVSLLKDNNLDGLSFDWEYPNAEGIGCNTKSPNDTENFLLFLKELRTALPNATLSAAAATTPFLSADGTPSTNVSEFANVFDYLQIMNYDIWGPWSDTTGPNAPLNDTCASDATQKVGSAVSAVEAWTKAGFPADQLVLGVAGYGHGFSVAPADALNNSILNPYSLFNKSFTPPGDAWDDAAGNDIVDVCGNPQAQGGNWNFWGLVEGGFLNENGTANTAEGIVYKYDECSQTPYVYNQTSGVMVAFDNAASFSAKGRFINATGLRGFAMWEAGGDHDDILLDAIRSAAGFPEVAEDDEDCEDDETAVTTPETSASGSTSGNSSGNTSGNNSGGSSSSSSGNTSSNNSGSNNSGSNSSSSGSSNASSNSGSTSTTTSNNSGSNNSGSNSSGPSNTTPDYSEDDEPTAVSTIASSKPTAAAAITSKDSEPAITSAVQPTSYAAPTAVTTASTSAVQPVTTPEPSLPNEGEDDEDDDEECEDDETIIEATTSVPASGTVSATTISQAAVTSAASASSYASESSYQSTWTASTGSSATSGSASTSTLIIQSASSVQPTASTSVVPTYTAVTESRVEPVTSAAPISSIEPVTSAAPTVSIEPVTSAAPFSSVEPVTRAVPTVSIEPVTSAEPVTIPTVPITSAAPTVSIEPVTSAEPVTIPTVPTTSASSLSSDPTVSAPMPTF